MTSRLNLGARRRGQRSSSASSRVASWLAFLLASSGAGCHFSRAPMHPETPAGSWYVVSRGETLDDIAKRAGVPAEDILELNGLSRPEDVKPGRLIFVLAPPGAPARRRPPRRRRR